MSIENNYESQSSNLMLKNIIEIEKKKQITMKGNKTLFEWIMFCEEGYSEIPLSFSFMLMSYGMKGQYHNIQINLPIYPSYFLSLLLL